MSGFEGENGKSMVSLLNEGKNVIVARTFSKIHGMAGLRVGYVAALPETLKSIQKITRGGMGITNTSIYAAIASMDDTAFQAKSKNLNKQAREYREAPQQMPHNYNGKEIERHGPHTKCCLEDNESQQ